MGLLEKIGVVDNREGWPWTEETDHDVYQGYNKHEWPKISIITPSYNQGKFIEETIRSVLLQNYPNLEYIIIDGGSTDDTVEIIQKYERWITYWISEKDDGQSHAINKGYRIATGEIINWLNSDDLLTQNSLFLIASCFLVEPRIDWVTGFRVVRNVNKIGLKFENHWEHRWVYYLFGIPDFPQEATFLRKRLVAKIGEIDTSLEYVMDVDFYYRMLAESNSGGFLRAVLTIMNEYNEQKTLRLDNRKDSEYSFVVKKHEKRFITKLFSRILYTRFYDIFIKLIEMLYTRKAKKRFHIFIFSSRTVKVEKKAFQSNTYNP
ncbi:glycosyltransferase family 2 protein [Haliscomenobacter hydrossis]|uniref:Glycosyl transferase family 2 n=1 Tax=Haliscomenobacter hydrossis (strain ATCC 27775 / DSM 1100 / LMG 10767 / O) TaxID=760192 RepID=F4L441_HALH1|nr:glycosyltransferase family 2 protein [Haliscomenobacter hydrossis]AEE50739.1 glycosyl transferase family 2 [Haliscomenobacter hydrossis DSM 1100]